MQQLQLAAGGNFFAGQGTPGPSTGVPGPIAQVQQPVKKEDPSRPLQQSPQQPPNAQLVNSNSQNPQQQQTQPQQQQQVRGLSDILLSRIRTGFFLRMDAISILVCWFISSYKYSLAGLVCLGASCGAKSASDRVLKTDIGFEIPTEVATETWCRHTPRGSHRADSSIRLSASSLSSRSSRRRPYLTCVSQAAPIRVHSCLNS